jgi:hypothetical protein
MIFPLSRLIHQAPLEPRGEAGAATATETRVLDGLDDPGVALVDDALGAVPDSTRLEEMKEEERVQVSVRSKWRIRVNREKQEGVCRGQGGVSPGGRKLGNIEGNHE